MFSDVRRRSSSRQKRYRVTPTGDFPYPNPLPVPTSDPDAEALRTRLLQIARLQKATIHQEQAKRLTRRHSIASSSPWTRLSLALCGGGGAHGQMRKLTDVPPGSNEAQKSQARALNEAKQLLTVLELQPTAPAHAPRRPPSADHATRSESSFSSRRMPTAVGAKTSASRPLSRSKSCISLSVSSFANQQQIKTHKLQRPQSASSKTSRRLRRHDGREQPAIARSKN